MNPKSGTFIIRAPEGVWAIILPQVVTIAIIFISPAPNTEEKSSEVLLSFIETGWQKMKSVLTTE